MPIVVTNNFPPGHGGIQTMISRLSESIARSREVLVVAPSAPGSAAYDATLAYRVVRYRPARRPLELWSILVAFLRGRRVSAERVTIASSWWPVGCALAFVPARIRGPFAILTYGNEVAPGQGGPRRALMRFVFARAGVTIAISRFTRDLLAQAGIVRNVHVIVPGVEARPIEPRRQAHPLIVSVGRLVERKGFDRMLTALALVGAEFPTLRYEIVGDGPQRAELQAAALRLGLAERVTFLGAVSQAALDDAYARAWCFALPVRRVRDDVEGFGIVYVEAALARLPAIGGIASGAADAIVDGETGLLVDGDDPGAIANAIRRILRDPEAAREMGNRGFARAMEMTWSRAAERVLDVLPA